MRSPLLFLFLAVLLMILPVAFVAQDYPEFHSTISEVVGLSVLSGLFFLIVAGISAVAAILTRSAPLDKQMMMALSILLALGGCWMLMIFGGIIAGSA